MVVPADSIFFDIWSSTYDRPGLQQSTYRPLHDAVIGRIRELTPDVVLDLGCGTGQLTRRLAATFPDAAVVGADLSAGMLERAAAANDRADDPAGESPTPKFVRADAERLPLSPGSVDLVVCTESFHWYTDQEAALVGIHDLLRPGGRFLIASIAAVTGAGDDVLRRASTAAGRPIRALSRRRLRRLLEDAGFEVTHQGRVARLGFLPWPMLTDTTRAT